MESKLYRQAVETGQPLTTKQLWEELRQDTASHSFIESEESLRDIADRIRDLFILNPEQGVPGLLSVILCSSESAYIDRPVRRCLRRVIEHTLLDFSMNSTNTETFDLSAAGHASFLLTICYLTDLFNKPNHTRSTQEASVIYMKQALDYKCPMAKEHYPLICKYDEIVRSYGNHMIYVNQKTLYARYRDMEKLYSQADASGSLYLFPFIIKTLALWSNNLGEYKKQFAYSRKYLDICPTDQDILHCYNIARKRVKKHPVMVILHVITFLVMQVLLSIPAALVCGIVNLVTSSMIIALISAIITLILCNLYVRYGHNNGSDDGLLETLAFGWLVGRM